jgi:PHD/YefM family antitoxin component YafN of YafNO toxin-antitoxin module
MQHFSVTEIQNTDSKALHQSAIEPVILTAESRSSYVIMSVENYQQLIDRLDRLEDIAALNLTHGWYRDFYQLQRLAAMDGDG